MEHYKTTINLPLLATREREPATCTTAPEVAKLLRRTRNLAQEVFSVITLDTQMRHINTHTITIGTLNMSPVHPREVFRVAITDNAAHLILSHNHPSGDPEPSGGDIEVTKQLVEAGRLMMIPILDHVIIGNNGSEEDHFTSLREAGLVEFS